MAFYYETTCGEEGAIVYKLAKIETFSIYDKKEIIERRLELDWCNNKSTFPILPYDSKKIDTYAVEVKEGFFLYNFAEESVFFRNESFISIFSLIENDKVKAEDGEYFLKE